MATVATPIGAKLPVEPLSAANPEADPDLERWQRERWAPHSTEPAPTNGMRTWRRGGGSFHDRTLAAREAERGE